MNDLEALAAADVGFVISAGDAAAAAAISASHASVKGTLSPSVIKAPARVAAGHMLWLHLLQASIVVAGPLSSSP